MYVSIGSWKRPTSTSPSPNWYLRSCGDLWADSIPSNASLSLSLFSLEWKPNFLWRWKLQTFHFSENPVHVVAIAFPWPRFGRIVSQFHSALQSLTRSHVISDSNASRLALLLLKTSPDISTYVYLRTAKINLFFNDLSRDIRPCSCNGEIRENLYPLFAQFGNRWISFVRYNIFIWFSVETRLVDEIEQ